MKDLDQQVKNIYLKDYKAPEFLIDHVDLCFELDEEKTRVVSILQLKRQVLNESSPLVLSDWVLFRKQMLIPVKAF